VIEHRTNPNGFQPPINENVKEKVAEVILYLFQTIRKLTPTAETLTKI